jgi:hypothetical protein
LKPENKENDQQGQDEESLTIKQKKENALKMTKSIKKMNAKFKASLEKK